MKRATPSAKWEAQLRSSPPSSTRTSPPVCPTLQDAVDAERMVHSTVNKLSDWIPLIQQELIRSDHLRRRLRQRPLNTPSCSTAPKQRKPDFVESLLHTVVQLHAENDALKASASPPKQNDVSTAPRAQSSSALVRGASTRRTPRGSSDLRRAMDEIERLQNTCLSEDTSNALGPTDARARGVLLVAALESQLREANESGRRALTHCNRLKRQLSKAEEAARRAHARATESSAEAEFATKQRKLSERRLQRSQNVAARASLELERLRQEASAHGAEVKKLRHELEKAKAKVITAESAVVSARVASKEEIKKLKEELFETRQQLGELLSRNHASHSASKSKSKVGNSAGEKQDGEVEVAMQIAAAASAAASGSEAEIRSLRQRLAEAQDAATTLVEQLALGDDTPSSSRLTELELRAQSAEARARAAENSLSTLLEVIPPPSLSAASSAPAPAATGSARTVISSDPSSPSTPSAGWSTPTVTIAASGGSEMAERSDQSDQTKEIDALRKQLHQMENILLKEKERNRRSSVASCGSAIDTIRVGSPKPHADAESVMTGSGAANQNIRACGQTRGQLRKGMGFIYSEKVDVPDNVVDESGGGDGDNSETHNGKGGRTQKAPKMEVPPVSRALIAESLKKHFLFVSMSNSELNSVVSSMSRRECKMGESVITEGEEGKDFFVVEDGTLEIIVGGTVVGEAETGDCFGELALLHNCPRAATVTAETSSALLWVLDRLSFRSALANATSSKSDSHIAALRKIELLGDLTDSDLAELATMVRVVKFEAGQTVITKGERGDCVYLIESGELVCTDIGSNKDDAHGDVSLTVGQYIGELALLKDGPRAATVKAETNCTLLVLDRHSFTQVLGGLREHLENNERLHMVQAVSSFHYLPLWHQKAIAAALKPISFEANTAVVTKGQGSSAVFYLVAEGELIITSKEVDVDIISSGAILEHLSTNEYLWICKGDHFGSLNRDDSGEACPDNNVVSMGHVECFTIDAEQFALLAEQNDPSRFASDADSLIDLDMYSMVCDNIGEGSFSTVRLMQHKQTKQNFAVKLMSKAKLHKLGQFQNAQNERSIMHRFNHPFIVRICESGQDEDNIYILMDHMPGGDMYSRLESCGWSFWLEHAVFYSACVLLALEEVHRLAIAYRDLKPENLLFDSDGYLVLCDFGFAKDMSGVLRTFTLCGTPEYLAPETILGRGYNKTVDWWAFGVLLYDMIVGASPFADANEYNQVSICRNIVQSRVKFPIGTEKRTKDLVKKLLMKNPLKRIGAGKLGASDVKSHPLFESVNWDEMITRSANPPWIPPANTLGAGV